MPPDAESADWFEGMTESNVREYRNALENRTALHRSLVERADSMRCDPLALLAYLNDELPEADRQIVADAGVRGMLHKVLQPSAAHFTAVVVLPRVLSWIREQADAEDAATTP
ncbi:hypothetical protein ACFS5L_38755 [Streptomyces phyllanthi]|uniref:hypothetical protein n=1 Tax=Streptomyces phyllanthi TaxID=1803180 RepID=UPI00337506F7